MFQRKSHSRGTGYHPSYDGPEVLANRRSGVVLVIVMTMLALFTLIALTFVVSATQFRRSAIATNRVEQLGDPPDALLNQALMQVLRGSRNPASVIGPHSLLEDVYGHSDAVVGIVVGQAPNSIGSGVSNFLPVVPAQGRTDLRSNAFPLPFLEFSAISLGGDRQPGRAGFNEGDFFPALPAADENDEVFQAGASRLLRLPLAFDDQWFGRITARPSPPYPAAGPQNPVVDNMIDYYVGRVITFLDGPLARRSTFVAYSGRTMIPAPGGGAFIPPTGPIVGRLAILMPEGMPGLTTQLIQQLLGSRFIINGRPFNGTGFGYNPEKTLPTAPQLGVNHQWLDWALADPALAAVGLPLERQSLALLPNPANPYYQARMRWDVGLAIHADEEYDAPDFQNMLLAGREWDLRRGQWTVVSPSLHRPDLVNFWANKFASGLGSGRPAYGQDWLMIPPEVRRRVILRPDPADHWDDALIPDGVWSPRDPFVDLPPYDDAIAQTEARDINQNSIHGPFDPNWEPPFANPDFDAINGPWDVDNDDDLAPDSVWVDLGMPVTTMPDGRQVKPLFAILCLDLDGRLNLNAHGSPAHYVYHKQRQAGAPLPARVGSTAFVPDEALVTGAYGYYIDRTNRSQPRRLTTQRFALRAPIPWGGREPFTGGGGRLSSRQYPMTPHGQGFSPSDVNLGAILSGEFYVIDYVEAGRRGHSTTAFRHNLYRWLLEGRTEYEFNFGAGGRLITPVPAAGRYGEVHLLNSQVPQTPIRPRAGMTRGGYDFSGDDNVPPAMAAARLPANTTHPGSFAGNMFAEAYHPQFGHYGTPPDLDGDGAVVLDYRGQPLYMNMGFSLIPDANLDYVGPVDSARLAFRPWPASVPNPLSVTAQNVVPVFSTQPDDPNHFGGGNPRAYAVVPEAIDEPTELDLSMRRRMSFSYGPDAVPGSAAGGGSPDEVTSSVPRQPLAGSGTPVAASMTTEVDSPLSPFELEAMIRSTTYGTANYASHRVRQILDVRADDAGFADRITTESWDIPCPYVAPTPELRNSLQLLGLPQTNLTFVDLLRARIQLETGLTDLVTVDRLVQSMIRPDGPTGNNYAARCVSPDLLAGLRMDLNAPFGNGWDDNGNGVIDEPFDADSLPTGVERGLYGSLRSPTDPARNLSFGLDLNRDGRVNAASERLARQDFAKQLFVLLMLVKDRGYRHPVPTETPASDPDRLTIRRLAQYCVNVVDFRDRDSIYTGFEYDEKPFTDENGDGYPWDVDGDLATTEAASVARGVVWGTEYPDVIITETLAFHDRRVKNTNRETSDASEGDGQTAGEYYKMTAPRDNSFDQVRVPQGSAFVELYATGNPNNPAASRDIYREFREQGDPADAPPRVGVDLGKVTPGGQPVWRLLVTTRMDGNGGGSTANNLPQRFRNQPETLNFEPHNPGSCTVPPLGSSSPIQADRVVLFRGYAAAPPLGQAVPDQGQPYFPKAPDVFFKLQTEQDTILLPGEYGVVGPQRTATGADTDANLTMIGTSKETGAGKNITFTNPRRIVLGRGTPLGRPSTDSREWLRVSDIDVDLDAKLGEDHFVQFPKQLPLTQPGNTSHQIRSPVPIPVSGFAGTRRIGFNISEPELANHYDAPAADASTAVVINDAGGSRTATFQDRYEPPLDKTLDESLPNRELESLPWAGTNLNYKSVLLQRLADPTRDWNADTNPYITVDWSVFDLTVYNGEQKDPGAPASPAYAPNNSPVSLIATRPQFGTRERGGRPGLGEEVLGTAAGTVNVKYSYMDLWSQPNMAEWDASGARRDWLLAALLPPLSSELPPPAMGPKSDNPVLISLSHTLGFLNTTYHYSHPNYVVGTFNQFEVSEQYKRWRFWEALDHEHADSPHRGTGGDAPGDASGPWRNRYLGAPWRPFPWLTFHNRPFANAMELMLVPASSPSRLLREFSMRQPNQVKGPGSDVNNDRNFGYHYAESVWGPPTGAVGPVRNSGPPYNHLLNFFHSSSADPTTTAAAANYYRLFEFVTVPSRFAGTQELLTGGIGTQTARKLEDAFEGISHQTSFTRTWPYTIPFNRMSRYREPGKINLNTAVDRWGQSAVTRGGINVPVDEHQASQPLPTVWQCLTNNFPIDWRHRRGSRYASNQKFHVLPSFSPWDDLVISRESRDIRGPDREWGLRATALGPTSTPQGYQSNINDPGTWPAVARFDPEQPALIMNPYRSYLGVFNVPSFDGGPLMTRRLGFLGSGNGNNTSLLAVDASLLRRKETVSPPVGPPGSTYRTDDPIFDPLLAVEFGFYDSYRPRAPLGNDGSGRRQTVQLEQFDTDFDYRHTDRNPAFRYQLYTKLGGNVTIRSNVYAIWITMGLFEVERVNPFLTNRGGDAMQLRYPDGFKLVREADAIYGSNKRYRIFAIVDRSIPVGFLRGENINVDRAILVRRVID